MMVDFESWPRGSRALSSGRQGKAMTFFTKNFTKLVLGQISIWVVACSLWFYIPARAFLAAPATGDLYAHSWSFQAFSFFVFRFPWCFLGLCSLLMAEVMVLRRFGLKE